MGKLLTPQPELFHAPVEKDVVYTPEWLARLVVEHFAPTGRVLDPCTWRDCTRAGGKTVRGLFGLECIK